MRTGDWIFTFSGVKWYVTDPHPDDVRIEDIAHALSLICRYGGHAREFYSVGHHSLIVMQEVWQRHGCDHALQMHALLHDAAEAYLGDVVRPLKATQPQYKLLEQQTQNVILAGLGLPLLSPMDASIIKHFDDVALMTERRDLINHGNIQWTPRAEPAAYKIVPLSPCLVEAEFLNTYRDIRVKLESEVEA